MIITGEFTFFEAKNFFLPNALYSAKHLNFGDVNVEFIDKVKLLCEGKKSLKKSPILF